MIHDLSLALHRLGVHVTLFAPSDSTTAVRRIGALPSLAALENTYENIPPGVPALLDAVRMDELRTAAHQFDVIHCHCEFVHAPTLGALRKRSLTTVHWRTDELDRQLFFETFPDLPVAAISRSQEAAIPLANRRGVVHHGIDADRYRLSLETHGYLAFIGRLTDQKRPDVAIEIAHKTGRQLNIAGTIDPGNPTYFEQRVRPHLGHTIAYVGPLCDRAKNDFLGHADALLFPIDWPEPFGLVMIEAMACGTPVIAWNRGSVPEIVEDGVTGFIVENIEEATAAVNKLHQLDRATIRKRFEARFTADRMARDYLAIYHQIATHS